MAQANQEDLLPHSPGTPFPFAQRDVRCDLAHGAGSDPYDGPMDRFGRVTDLLWYDYGSSADLLRFKHGYDRAGNRLYREEADTSDLDQLYAYDDVNRLVQSEEGALSVGKDSISSLNFKQQWSLDATGNWSGFKEDDDGDSTWDLEQTRTSNAVNEITDVGETTGPSWITPAYNRAGNMTTIPQPGDPTQSYAATYDAWNRLVKLEEGEDAVAEYVFDGAMRLVVRKKYASGSLSQTRHFYHTAAWQTIEERLESGGSILSTADRQFTWGLRYIDDLVCRTVTSTHDYAYQDPNWNVILSSSALARVVYEPYGQIRSTCPAAQGDLDAWQHYFAGYRRDEDTGLYLVRHRVYQPELGCWVQRDPVGDENPSVTLYTYASCAPHSKGDPDGLKAFTIQIFYYWTTLKLTEAISGEVDRIFQHCVNTQMNEWRSPYDSLKIKWTPVATKAEFDAKPFGWVGGSTLFHFCADGVNVGSRDTLKWDIPGQTGDWVHNMNVDRIKKDSTKAGKSYETAVGTVVAHEAGWHSIAGNTFHAWSRGYVDAAKADIGSDFSYDACCDIVEAAGIGYCYMRWI